MNPYPQCISPCKSGALRFSLFYFFLFTRISIFFFFFCDMATASCKLGVEALVSAAFGGDPPVRAHCPFTPCVFKCLIMHFLHSFGDVHHSSQTANKVTREIGRVCVCVCGGGDGGVEGGGGGLNES